MLIKLATKTDVIFQVKNLDNENMKTKQTNQKSTIEQMRCDGAKIRSNIPEMLIFTF